MPPPIVGPHTLPFEFATRDTPLSRAYPYIAPHGSGTDRDSARCVPAHPMAQMNERSPRGLVPTRQRRRRPFKRESMPCSGTTQWPQTNTGPTLDADPTVQSRCPAGPDTFAGLIDRARPSDDATPHSRARLIRQESNRLYPPHMRKGRLLSPTRIDKGKTPLQCAGSGAQTQSTFCLFSYQSSICGAAKVSMRARLIFMVGVRQPFSMLQGSFAMTIIFNCS